MIHLSKLLELPLFVFLEEWHLLIPPKYLYVAKKNLQREYLLSIFSISAFSQSGAIKTKKQVGQITETSDNVSWETRNCDFGSIEQNLPAEAKFVFTNTSKEPISILRVKSSCGCTVTGFDKVPVLPGHKSIITATYNAKKMGSFRKSITVSLSDNKQYSLAIKGVVVTNENVTMK